MSPDLTASAPRVSPLMLPLARLPFIPHVRLPPGACSVHSLFRTCVHSKWGCDQSRRPTNIMFMTAKSITYWYSFGPSRHPRISVGRVSNDWTCCGRILTGCLTWAVHLVPWLFLLYHAKLSTVQFQCVSVISSRICFVIFPFQRVSFWSRRPSTSVNFPQLSFFWLVNLLPPDRSGPFNEKILFRFRRWSASRKSVTIDEVLWHIRNSKIWRPFIGNIIGNLNIFYIMKPIKGDYRQQYRKYTEITIVILYRK